jgi:hypothetical protein
LKDEQHRPSVLRVEPVLQLRERLHAQSERLLSARFVLLAVLQGVVRIDLLQPELVAVVRLY